ncbi:MAG: flagellar hook assembly protein FlgD [Desulfatiglandales bacterium]
MMINQIAGINTVSEENLYAEKSNDSLGRDEFLKLFLAQMNHQDPLNPMDCQELSSQLAQFSTLEQLYNVNENLEGMGATQAESNQYQALNFIGKDIVAKGDSLVLEQGQGACGSFVLADTAECTVTITDTAGFPVGQVGLGTLEAGEHAFTWNGRDLSGDLQEPGTYKFIIRAAGPLGQDVSVDTLVTGKIDRVSLQDDSPILYVGDIPFNISQIISVKVSDNTLSADESAFTS